MINFEKADKLLTSIGIYPTNIIAEPFAAGAVPRYSLEAEIDTLKFIKKLSDFNERKEKDNMPSYYGELLTNSIYNLGFLNQKKEEDKLPKKYILNKDACVCFWKDGTKTISKRQKEDDFDKEIGFLFACWQYYNKDKSRNLRKKILACIKYECMKDFLFEKFRAENKMTTEQAKKYLGKLKVEEDKKIEKKIEKHMKEGK